MTTRPGDDPPKGGRLRRLIPPCFSRVRHGGSPRLSGSSPPSSVRWSPWRPGPKEGGWRAALHLGLKGRTCLARCLDSRVARPCVYVPRVACQPVVIMVLFSLRRYAMRNWPFAGFCEGPQDAGNGFPAILRPGVARVEFQREPMSRRGGT